MENKNETCFIKCLISIYLRTYLSNGLGHKIFPQTYFAGYFISFFRYLFMYCSRGFQVLFVVTPLMLSHLLTLGKRFFEI